ncbi:MAG: hypothetical protein ABIR24_11305 [Verrucomicrobiota bacterium]
MSDPISIKLTAESELVMKRLQAFPGVVLGRVARAMDKENHTTIGHISSVRMRGNNGKPFAPALGILGIRTGHLYKTLRQSAASVVGSEVVSSIGTNVEYAGVHEFGFEGDVTVKSHQRKGGAGDKFSVTGSHVSRIAALRMGALSKKQAGAQAQNSGKYIFKKTGAKKSAVAIGQVKSHSRHVKITARAPIQHGIADRVANYSQSISAAVIEAWNGGGLK